MQTSCLMRAHVHVFASAVLIFSTLLCIQIRLIQYPFLEEPALSEWLTCSCKCFADDTNWSAAERSNHYTRAMQQCTCPHPSPCCVQQPRRSQPRSRSQTTAQKGNWLRNRRSLRRSAQEPPALQRIGPCDCWAYVNSPGFDFDWPTRFVSLQFRSPHACIRLPTSLRDQNFTRIHCAHHDRKIVALEYVMTGLHISVYSRFFGLKVRPE